GAAIDLGGADASGALGLTDPELDRITAATIVVGDNTSGAITISATIDRAAATNLVVTTGGNSITFSGGALSTAGNVTLSTSAGGAGGIVADATGTDVTANNLIVTAS